MKDSEILRGAQSEVIERGWGKGELVAKDGSVCVMGAAAFAAGITCPRYITFDDELSSVARCLADSRPNPIERYTQDAVLVTGWYNDDLGHIDEALEWLERAEKLALIREEGDE